MRKYPAGAYWEKNAEAWTRLSRAGCDVYRDALNLPAFLRMLPAVKGKRGLDIGCGEGFVTRELARLGARMQGLDISPTFIRFAEEAEQADPLGIRFHVADAAELPFSEMSVDFVSAFMCLMDIANLEAVLNEVHRVLTPGGFLQFSITHPCFVPPYRKVLYNEDGSARAVELAGYFDTSERMDRWMFWDLSERERRDMTPFEAPRYHKTLSTWIDTLTGAGFKMEKTCEPSATQEEAAAHPAVADTREFPQALIIRAGKRP